MPENIRRINLCRIIFNLANNTGGSSVHCLELSQNIDSHLNQQFIITSDSYQNSYNIYHGFPSNIYKVGFIRCKLLVWIKSQFISVLPIAPFVRLSFGLSAIVKCIELNTLYGIDIVQVHGIGNAIVTTLLKHLIHKPTILMLHGSLGSYSKISDIYESLILKLTVFDHYFILDHGSTILTKAYRLLSDKSRFTIVPVNIDSERYQPKKTDPQIVLKLGISGKFVFTSVHSLEPVQGVDLTLMAFSLFVNKYSVIDSVILIIGDGSLRQKLIRMVKMMNITKHVFFIGRVAPHSIPNYFSVADVALATSPMVNMNRSTHEAMACQKTVIAFNTGNTTDQLIKHMERGILVPNYRVDKLADAMFLLYSDRVLRNKLGNNARSFIVQQRDWKDRINTEMGVYEELLRTRRR